MSPRIRKAWHVLRRRLRSSAGRPARLIVGKARWLNAATSPVVLMIDDLANAWHGQRGDATWVAGGDWGGGHADPRGAVAFLEQRLLAAFPEVKTTFFVVAGPISAYTHHQPFSSSLPLDADAASASFFRALTSDPRYELAYHGYNHGSPGGRTEEFVQEWRGFGSVAAAVEQTRRGLEIFQRATGRAPTGGKYGGWDYNEFAGEAVSACGFEWWCPDWTPRDVTGAIDPTYYEPQFFGPRLVVALPSTVHGHFWDARQIEVLLAHGQVISIEEHIAPVRPDGLIQTPNMVDDIDELRRLYRYLRTKPVWHATCGEIAAYVVARERSIVYDVARDGFSLRYDGRATAPALTLSIDAAATCDSRHPRIIVTTPDGALLPAGAYRYDESRYRHLVTIPVVPGRYRVQACDASGAIRGA